MKIAFYLPNKNISTVDFSNIDLGNPGVGGSEFSVVLIASNLCKRGNIDIVVYCDKSSIFPSGLKWAVCNDIVGAMKLCVKHNIDYIVVDGKLLTKEIVYRFSNIKFIAWANTFIPREYQDFFARRGNVVKIVNVGKEEMELTREHDIYRKSLYIYNAVPTAILSNFPHLKPNRERNHNVCYIGSLHPAKGFQYLAKAWQQVLLQVPDAQLFVVGSGRLYGRGIKLGKWGIADQKFEREFMPYLIKEGKIIESVHFMGILGVEKYKVLESCKVGIPNPSGVSETFGYTAVEMQFMGCQVTTKKCPGYIDTVYYKENLYDNIDDLAYYIVKLLQNDAYDSIPVLNYIDNFSIDKITLEWENLFSSLTSGVNAEDIKNDKEFYIYMIKYYIDRVRSRIKRLKRLV